MSKEIGVTVWVPEHRVLISAISTLVEKAQREWPGQHFSIFQGEDIEGGYNVVARQSYSREELIAMAEKAA